MVDPHAARTLHQWYWQETLIQRIICYHKHQGWCRESELRGRCSSSPSRRKGSTIGDFDKKGSYSISLTLGCIILTPEAISLDVLKSWVLMMLIFTPEITMKALYLTHFNSFWLDDLMGLEATRMWEHDFWCLGMIWGGSEGRASPPLYDYENLWMAAGFEPAGFEPTGFERELSYSCSLAAEDSSRTGRNLFR